MHDRRPMRGEIVQHHVDLQRGRDRRVDLPQKRDEIGSAVTRFTWREHLAGGDVQRGTQVERAGAKVIVRASFWLPDVHWQNRLRALKGLNLRLLVEGEHGGIGRRIHVEADDVAHLLDELGVRRHLERLGQMRFQTTRAPDPADHRVAHPRSARRRPGAPVGFAGRRRFERGDDYRLDVLVRNRARRASPGFIVDAFQSLVDEPLAPLANGRIGGAVRSRHRAVQRAVCARQDETRPERHRSIDARPLREPDQRVPLVISHD